MALEAAVLDAAWAQLLQAGSQGFTYEAVAARASTNKSVLYRRWPTRRDLLAATLGHRGEQDRLPDVDTGTLRGDVLALLSSANARPERYVAMLAALGSDFRADGIHSPEDFRTLFRGREPGRVHEAVTRALQRGEIAEPLSTDLIGLPFDLFLSEVLRTLQPLDPKRTRWIVDEVFLPLVTRAQHLAESAVRIEEAENS